MQLPDYWLPRPEAPLDEVTRQAFDALIDAALARADGPLLDYALPAPKWQFLCYAAEARGLALHGSGNPAIARFEPRASQDLSEFGRQTAVYAAADGIWSMFFAVVDRARFPLTVSNACIRLAGPDGAVLGPFYHFSVSRPYLPQRPWRAGTVYLLPRETFIQQPSLPFGDFEVLIAQLASLVAVRPVARLAVGPEDFPFLDRVRAHDDERLAEYSEALQTGRPWPE
jgi:hypothetical protein